MARPAYVSNATTLGSGAATTLVANLPASIAAGDLLFASVSGASGAGSASASGWTVIANASRLGNDTSQYLTTLYKLSAGGESSTVTFTMSVSCFRQSVILRISTSHQTTPIDVSVATVGNSISPLSSSVTVANNESLLIWIASNLNEACVPTSPFSGAAAIVNFNNQGILSKDVEAGATGTLGATITTDPWCCRVIVIAPAASGAVANSGVYRSRNRVTYR